MSTEIPETTEPESTVEPKPVGDTGTENFRARDGEVVDSHPRSLVGHEEANETPDRFSRAAWKIRCPACDREIRAYRRVCDCGLEFPGGRGCIHRAARCSSSRTIQRARTSISFGRCSARRTFV